MLELYASDLDRHEMWCCHLRCVEDEIKILFASTLDLALQEAAKFSFILVKCTYIHYIELCTQ